MSSRWESGGKHWAILVPRETQCVAWSQRWFGRRIADQTQSRLPWRGGRKASSRLKKCERVIIICVCAAGVQDIISPNLPSPHEQQKRSPKFTKDRFWTITGAADCSTTYAVSNWNGLTDFRVTYVDVTERQAAHRIWFVKALRNTLPRCKPGCF